MEDIKTLSFGHCPNHHIPSLNSGRLVLFRMSKLCFAGLTEPSTNDDDGGSGNENYDDIEVIFMMIMMMMMKITKNIQMTLF